VVKERPSKRVKPKNLPTYLTGFVGRERELEKVQTCLRDPACRLLTLFGPGGVGKTRLALEAVAQSEGFVDGMYFVSLESAEGILSAVTRTLGISTQSEDDLEQQLMDHLRGKEALLILDGFEHLIEGTGLVVDILAAAPGVRIVATSRFRLNVPGERLLPIAGLEIPPPACSSAEEKDEDQNQYSAVQLFLDSARRVRPGFGPSAGWARCRRPRSRPRSA
jgi:predicted ATPase